MISEDLISNQNENFGLLKIGENSKEIDHIQNLNNFASFAGTAFKCRIFSVSKFMQMIVFSYTE